MGSHVISVGQESFIKGAQWHVWLLVPLLIGLMLGIVMSALDRLFTARGISTGFTHPTFPLSVIASGAAGIGEEILFRLFMLGFWAFFLTLFFGCWIPKQITFWMANVLAALAFGAAHLPTVMVLSQSTSLSSIPPPVFVEVFLFNGLIGLMTGYWFRRLIITHIF